MRVLIDLTGQKFFRFTVISFSHTTDIKGKKMRMWNCKCECGEERVISSGALKFGRHKSCGCLAMEVLIKRSTTHGQTSGASFTPEYRLWQNMNTRCYNPNNKRYGGYGGRGITVCDRWRNSFEDFFEDVGNRPSSKYTFDRIDNDGNYEPNNWRWATPKQQADNRRNSVWLEYNGLRMTMSDWARHWGLSTVTTLRDYIERNGVEKAMLHYAKKLNR